MILTIQVQGTEKRLYQLIAPLVMNPDVLSANNNYPFKTTDKFVWFVAVSGKKVVGFIPIEQRGNVAIINNYYIDKDQEEAFSFLLIDVVSAFAGEKSLAAVVQTEHQETFEKQGFTVEKVWKRYVKMWRDE